MLTIFIWSFGSSGLGSNPTHCVIVGKLLYPYIWVFLHPYIRGMITVYLRVVVKPLQK
jgi:hypothetical protein